MSVGLIGSSSGFGRRGRTLISRDVSQDATHGSAPQPAGSARRLPVQGRRRRGRLRRQGGLDPQAGGLALLRARALERRHARAGPLDRLPRDRDRGGGAAHRAADDQAPPAALQHPAARRQVVPVRGNQPRRGVPTRLLHARAAPVRASLLRPVLEREAHARDARASRQALPVPDVRRPRARPALRRPLSGLLHQALPGAVRRLHRPRGVPAQHRGDRGLPLRPLPGRRARPGAQDGRRFPRRGVRARGRLPGPPGRRPVPDAAPARRGRHPAQRRRDRGRARRPGRQRPGLPGSRRRARRAPELLPGERGGARRGRGRRRSSSLSTTPRCRRSRA